MPRARDNDETVRRATADLRRLDEQSEKLLGARGQRLDEAGDPIEVWGKRIGRGLGLIAAAVLVWHLVSTYVFK